MFRKGDYYSGEHSRSYRTVREIKQDMHYIGLKIKEANEKLNLRSVLIDIISDSPSCASSDPAFWISELEMAISDAKAAYDALFELNEELSMLQEELIETRCAMGV